MRTYENKIKKFNIALAILMMLLLSLIMNYSVLFAQESHETGLISGYSETPENNILNTKNYNIIKFEVPREQHLSISLFDEYGNMVKILLYDNIQPGVYEYDLTNQIPGGKYLCKLISGDISESKELILK